MNEMQRPQAYSFIRHTQLGELNGEGGYSSAGGLHERLSARGRQQAALLGAVALRDITDGHPARILTSPHQYAKETAQIAYPDNPTWIDNDLREHVRSAEESETAQQIAIRALHAIARAQKYSQNILHPIAITHARVMAGVRMAAYSESMAHSPDEANSDTLNVAIPYGTIDTYKIADDGSITLRTTPLGQNPHAKEFTTMH